MQGLKLHAHADGYINAQAPHLQTYMRLMYPEEKGPTSAIPNSGPAPVLMRLHEWIKVCSLLRRC